MHICPEKFPASFTFSLDRLGETLPAEARAESGVREYHRWFSKGVLRWLELAVCRARSMIRRAVDLDILEPQDNYCKFSSSASDTLGVFNEVSLTPLLCLPSEAKH